MVTISGVHCIYLFLYFSLSTETPLCIAAGLKPKSSSDVKRLIMTLVDGGAILDFRAKDGFAATAVHRAVAKNNAAALRTLLDLGASPNYKDSKSLTPLYYSVSGGSSSSSTSTTTSQPSPPSPSSSGKMADVEICLMLLKDRATLGAQDSQVRSLQLPYLLSDEEEEEGPFNLFPNKN